MEFSWFIVQITLSCAILYCSLKDVGELGVKSSVSCHPFLTKATLSCLLPHYLYTSAMQWSLFVVSCLKMAHVRMNLQGHQLFDWVTPATTLQVCHFHPSGESNQSFPSGNFDHSHPLPFMNFRTQFASASVSSFVFFSFFFFDFFTIAWLAVACTAWLATWRAQRR